MGKIYKYINNENNFIRITGYIFIVLLFFYSGCDRLVDTSQTDNGLPPAVPVGLQVAYATDGEVVLAWQSNSEADLAGYNIYRSTDSTNFVMIGNSSYNYYYDDSLQYNEIYYYRITAIDIWNNESQPTAIVSAKPINRYIPSAPIGLSINARNYQGSLSVYLIWNPNYESDIEGFNIYRSTNQNFKADSTNLVGFSTDINYTDTLKLSLYTTYYYKIKSFNTGGESPDSATSTVIIN